MGSTGPSANPISARNSSKDRKPATRPEAAENNENASTAATSIGFFTPRRSDQAPRPRPDKDQVSAKADASMPRCAGVKRSSAAMKGKRKDSASRSKNTKPKLSARMASNLFS